MRRPLKTTTALVTSFALAVPVTFPAMAQEGRSRADIQAEVCTDAMTQDECNVAVSEASQAQGGNAEAEEDAQPQAEAEAAPEADVGATVEGSAPSLETLTEQLGGAVQGEAPADALQPEAQAEAPVEAQPEAQPEVQAEAPAETPVEAQPEAQAEAPAEVQPEIPAEAQAEAPVEAVPETAPQAEAQAPAETPVAPQAEVQAETPVDPRPQAEATTEATTEAAPDATAEEEPSTLDRIVNALGGGSDEEATAEGEAQTEATTEATTEDATTEGETAPDATAETATEEEPSTLDRIVNALGGGSDEAEATAETEQDVIPTEPSDAAAEAATGEAEAPLAATEAGDVVEESTETVTEDNARLSSEDYARTDTTAAPEGEAAAQQAQGQQEDDNFNRFLQGALVGAAGALVVGALLNDNREVVGTSPDRVVVRDRNGHLQVLRDDDAILRQPGSEVTTRRYSDGSSETVVLQRDGSQVVTVRNAEARVVKRVVIHPDGSRTILFDDTQTYEPVVIADLPEPNRQAPRQVDPQDERALRVALESQAPVGRAFSLNQIRQIDRVRYLAPAAQVQNITFDTGSAAISPDEARNLLALGELMTSMIAENPNEVFLIEGHTDAVGSDVMNLTLSDRRAESVARALTEYFGVSPANMVLQGYGESDLRIRTEAAERENRRVVVRRITPLLQVASN
ncbi:OmpA family protein [Pararhodobacter aggregans]|uniref:OmpA-like domain-containing protein n=1 Tax=Pararhodobacter aggregans TaxID=404875 RepID=A0A2T7UR77_9RHOB|nr:OmpA family protein [Pararhodobacter aggregans]PTX01900.1 outer membrane protein OmpA-like peptidoglycan-associated protein [Pararhodobacter aggregans]PVE47091.1 hypothetical protein DDE23_12625 [Pararhodobacter aggregans]